MSASDEKHNIVIVGAGIIGMSMIREEGLTMKKDAARRITLLDTPHFHLKLILFPFSRRPLLHREHLERYRICCPSLSKAGGLISLGWHQGPTVSLGRLSFAEHANLAAQHNGKDRWEYRRLDVYTVEASHHARSSRRRSVPADLNWLNQQGLTVKSASRDGTTEDVKLVLCL